MHDQEASPSSDTAADTHARAMPRASSWPAASIFSSALAGIYLFLPFAALCVAATLMGGQRLSIWVAATPLAAADPRHARRRTARRAPMRSVRRTTIRFFGRGATRSCPGFSGAIWGAGALLWFVPHSFPAQAYLSLAFLGITATEFIARSAYRPAYLAHAALSLGAAGRSPADGRRTLCRRCRACWCCSSAASSTPIATASPICSDESIRLRWENAGLVASLSREKKEAERARDVAEASDAREVGLHCQYQP